MNQNDQLTPPPEQDNITLLEDSADDIDEPKLTYERILGDSTGPLGNLADVIRTDSITSSCLHNKFLAVGTLYGRIHFFDHQGNKVKVRKELCAHLKSVNCISIDDRGEYLVSCSDDKLVVYGLFNEEHDDVQHKPMNVVAIDPYFNRQGGGRRFVAGDDRVVLYVRAFSFLAENKYKPFRTLQEKRQKVRALSWHDQHIAWATDHAIQIYDLELDKIITRIKRDSESIGIDPCQFCWRDNRTLIIGWNNTIRICLIRERSPEELKLKELPRRCVEYKAKFDTDFTVCGIAPFNKSLITLSIDHPRKRVRRLSINTQYSQDSTLTSPNSPSISTETSQYSISNQQAETSSISLSDETLIRPQVHIIDTFFDSYDEISKDVLTPNGCLTLGIESKMEKSLKNFPYTLLSLHNDGIYFLVCPKDVISARPRDHDDHIDWLIKHSMLEECCSYAKEKANELNRHTVKDIEELYMKELLDRATPESYSEAAKISSSICGNDQKRWDQAIQNFCDLRQLKQLLPYLPKRLDSFHLQPESYNLILREFLDSDSVSFFKAIKEIPSQLYSLQIMTDQVIRNLSGDPKNLVLNEALAELYTRMGRFEDAVNIYLDYNDRTRIFSLIRNNSLVSILRDRVDKLMQIDADETSKLLVENIDSIPMKDIVERLERYKSSRFLVSYLHRLVLKDSDSCIEYHDLMVKLYAQHQRESLLNFLKLSTNYSLEEALRICTERNLIKEVVFLYSRMGDLRVALKYITESQGDINEAIEFCKEHQDPELWQDLIQYSMDKPEFIGALLKSIGTHIEDPIELINRIPDGVEIEGLMPALVKILQDYQLQISLEQSCRDLMAKDCFTLLEKQIGCQTQGIAVKEDQVCPHCNQPLLNESVAGLGSATTANTGGSAGGSSNLNDLVVFGCHHVFHEECCAESEVDSDGSKTLTCRVCMLEKD